MIKSSLLSKKNDFIKSTLTIFVGKFSGQLVSLLLLPIYTKYLLTSDYGYLEIMIVYMTLFAPIATFQIEMASFRYMIEARNSYDKRRSIYSTSVYLILVTVLVFAFIGLTLDNIFNLPFAKYFIVYFVVFSFNNVLTSITRGIGMNREFAASSIIGSIDNKLVFCNSFGVGD
jgi:O-antigen/teichoic acid export membrane protein